MSTIDISENLQINSDILTIYVDISKNQDQTWGYSFDGTWDSASDISGLTNTSHNINLSNFILEY